MPNTIPLQLARAQRCHPAGNPSPVWMMRLPDVIRATGLSKSTLYDRIRAGSFPAPISLGARAVAWPSDAIDAWIAERLQEAAGKAVAA